MRLHFWPTLSSLLLCSFMGCQTAAQRQYLLIREKAQSATARLTECFEKIVTNQAYNPLREHMPFVYKGEPPTLSQLANTKYANDEEIELIITRSNENAICRALHIQEALNIIPGLVPTLVDSYYKVDLVLVDLIQKEITYGEANKRLTVITNTYLAKFRATEEQIGRDLATSHETEWRQRQQALNALAQWTYQQQLLYQRQQLINSITRPHITTCSSYGTSVQCISR